jgi:hypothetical protein
VLRFLSDMARRISNWLNTPPPVRASAEDWRWPLTCSACGWLLFYPQLARPPARRAGQGACRAAPEEDDVTLTEMIPC